MLKTARSQILLARAVALLVLMLQPVPLGLQRLVLLQNLGSTDEGHGKHAGLQVRLHNVTLWGQKAWAYLDEMDIQTKPDIIEAVEVHLRGNKLNQARRRAKSMGWNTFTTPAVGSQWPGHVLDATSSSSDRTFANH